LGTAQAQDSHWEQGFALPRVVRKAGGVVQTCCLKTHRYGGHFTLSLKNSVGFAAKLVPGNSYNFMRELHSSPNQRRMIAEINTAYKPDLILLDGVQAFTNGGPDHGKMVESNVILAGTDRVAIVVKRKAAKPKAKAVLKKRILEERLPEERIEA
jgi:uncharacterized protein (DUF362 family)